MQIAGLCRTRRDPDFKTEGGRISDAQRDFRCDMEKAGEDIAVAVGVDAALDTLSGWGLLRGSVH